MTKPIVSIKLLNYSQNHLMYWYVCDK